ncbi:MAG TPA: ATP phosphoribosyltransferase, partial [Thermoanaerobaculia bacterium]|nr:ATP phosphoribosyltransferase [Thermoanaerobaculia bacterium]
MIRLALPKGRNLDAALAAFRAAGIHLSGLDSASRSLRLQLREEGIEVLSLKDWDLPLYVTHGIADCGIVGSDVLDEVDG